MKGCVPINLDPLDLAYRVKMRQAILFPQAGHTVEDSAASLEKLNELFTIDDTDPTNSEYVLVTDKEARLRRTTTVVEKKKRKSSGKQNDTPDAKLKQEGGTLIHDLWTRFIDAKVNQKEKVSDIYASAASGNIKIDKKLVEKIEKSADAKIAYIKARQKAIDPSKEVIIKVENILVSPEDRMAGRGDLIALYSNNTADYLDLKTISPNRNVTKNGKIAYKNWVPDWKKDSYLLTTREYKRMLLKLGVSEVNVVSVVPAAITYKSKESGKRKSGEQLERVIDKLEFEEDNALIQDIPMLFSKSEYKGINDLIERQADLLRNLKAKLGSGLSDEEYSRTINKVYDLRRSIENLQDKKSLSGMLEYIQTELLIEVREKLKNPDYFKGKSKEFILSELKDLMDELDIYTSTTEKLMEYITDNKKDTTLSEEAYQLAGKVTIQAQSALHAVKQKYFDTITEEIDSSYFEGGNKDSRKLRAMQPESWFKRVFGRLSTFNNPIIKQFWNRVSQNNADLHLDMVKLSEDVMSSWNKVLVWGKENGISRTDIWKKFIDTEREGKSGKVMNYHSKISAEGLKLLYEARKAYEEDKDSKRFKQFYQIKSDSGYKEWYAEQRKKELNRLNAIYSTKVSAGIYTDAKAKEEITRELTRWESFTDLSKDSAWGNKRLMKFLELKPDFYQKYKNPKFAEIENNPALSEFYNKVIEYNALFRELTESNMRDLPDEHLAWIRKTTAERVSDSNVVGLADSFSNAIKSMNYREDDTEYGELGIDGEEKKTIPKFGMTPFDASEKSMDLPQSLILFGKMAYNYHYMSKLEAEGLALRHLLVTESSEIAKDLEGNPITSWRGEVGKKAVGKNREMNNLLDTYDAMLNYYVYGEKIQQKGRTYDIPLVGKVNTTKLILGVKNFHAMNSLGLGFIPGIAGGVAARMGTMVQASKGQYFDNKQLNAAQMSAAKEHNKHMALSEFFSPYADDFTYRKALEASNYLRLPWVGERISERMLFAPFRIPDEMLDRLITNAASRNYGLDKQGKVRRLVNLPEGTKSIWEMTSFDEKGKIKFEGLNDTQTELLFKQFREAVRQMQMDIKGNMSGEDISMVQTNLYWGLLMQFKTWMPGVLSERFGETRYDEATDTLRMGRYLSYFNVPSTTWNKNATKKEKTKAIAAWVAKDLAPQMLKATASIIPYVGKTFQKESRVNFLGKEYVSTTINAKKALEDYEAWIKTNPVESKKVSFDMFLRAKEAQIPAMLMEMRLIALFFTFVTLLSLEGDDEEPLYRETWAGRVTYKIAKKTFLELGFSLNPNEFYRLSASPIPAFKVLKNFSMLAENTYDETRDTFFGENSPQDKTPWLYRTVNMTIGLNQAAEIIEIFEEDKKVKY